MQFSEKALTSKQRKSIPASKFGVPSRAKTAAGKAKSGSFPMQDKKHARLALSFIKNAPAADKPRIRAKARAMGVGKGAKKSK